MTSLVAPFFAVNSGGCESEFSPHVSEKRFHKIKLDLCMYVCILIRMIGLLNNLSLSLTMSLKRRTLCACGVQIHQMVTKKAFPYSLMAFVCILCTSSLFFIRRRAVSLAHLHVVFKKRSKVLVFLTSARTPYAATVLWHAHQPSRQMICPPSPSRLHRHLDFQPSDQAPFSFLPRWRLFVRKR